MSILKSVWHKSQGVEKKFKHQSILFIPTESYDAATITVMQGLQELGWRVFVIGKPNINSWFVNEVIEDPRKVKFDFVLSNLHWGNRWDYYDKFRLHGRLKVLVDGCDNRRKKNWEEKYDFYYKKYGRLGKDVTKRELQPWRWMNPLHGYKPDIVFTSQKPFGDKTYYLPFGIRREYLRLREGKSGGERQIDFANFPGPGSGRERLTDFLERTKLLGIVHNKNVRGTTESSLDFELLMNVAFKDNNVHSWHRWLEYPDYFRVLNDTKVLIYPNVYTDRAHWDSMRIWEAYASGCLVLLEKPNVDMSQYPATELCKEAQYTCLRDLVGKCKRLYSNQGRLEQLRLQAVEGALRYFSPVSLARLFLWRILSEQKGKDGT